MKLCFLAVVSFLSLAIHAQKIDKIITEKEVTRVESILAADDMQGRQPFTPGIEKAAQFIADEFKQARLSHLPGLKSYMQQFEILTPKTLKVEGVFNDIKLSEENCMIASTDEKVNISSLDRFKQVYIPKGADFFSVIRAKMELKEHTAFLVHTSHEKAFKRLKRFVSGPSVGKNKYEKLFILTADSVVNQINIEFTQVVKAETLKNVVGYLPGKTKPNEFVIFSGHYDHLGVKANSNKTDSIFNGANDDAAGITAVIMLSKYFSAAKAEGRSIIFVAFTAEESGGFGSKYFSEQLNPKDVVAMFNIEMIGTESKWGTNSAYITGFDKSDMGKILQQNLAGSAFKFEPDPYPSQNLFYRSDNATLAALGVPAHTISTAKMDKEPFYHSADDEIETLNMRNMTEIIKAIALSSQSIVAGKDTPSRVAKVD